MADALVFARSTRLTAHRCVSCSHCLDATVMETVPPGSICAQCAEIEEAPIEREDDDDDDDDDDEEDDDDDDSFDDDFDDEDDD